MVWAVRFGKIHNDPMHQPALKEHQTGKIIVDGIELNDDLKRIDRIRREVGMVFSILICFLI